MRRLRALATAMALGVTLVSCSAQVGHGTSHGLSPGGSGQAPPLRSEADAQFTYTLDDLRPCEVGDAIAIAINQAREPLRVTAVTVAITGHGIDQSSYQIAAVRPGFIGEIATSFRLFVLAGYHLEPALGALLSPVSASGQGYVFVVWLRVLGKHPRPWAITGLTVRYQLRQKAYTAFFPQEINLPPVTCSK